MIEVPLLEESDPSRPLGRVILDVSKMTLEAELRNCTILPSYNSKTGEVLSWTLATRLKNTPEARAESAVNSLCQYDAIASPADWETTMERLAEFQAHFVRIAAKRLAEVARKAA